MIKKLTFSYICIIVLTLLYIKLVIYYNGTGGGIYISYVALFGFNVLYILIDLVWTWIAHFLADVLWISINLNKKYSIPVIEFAICILYIILRPSLGLDCQINILSFFPVIIPKFAILLHHFLKKTKTQSPFDELCK